ncbi:MAG: HlyD family efflux transporter periplasmic adaptor subunit [Phycisphaerales bacterium]|nr:HlyD family efflux transporter periplasmic adaptor subunit [Planctomycetota bacterium]MCH8509493.1 HlyD family efflux transporter periplasmic adaptor subunit [Phycisphaerales bacterium]
MKQAGMPGKRKRRGISLWSVVLAVVVLATTGVGFIAFAGSGESSNRVVSLDLGEAAIRSFTITTLANGELEAKNQLEIRNRVESRTAIVEIIPEGTTVRRGEVLIRLADESLRNRIAEEELSVIEARTNLENAEAAEKIQISENDSKLRAAESKKAIAQLTFQQWQSGDVVRQRQQLQLAVERAEKNLERLSNKYTNSKDLFANDFLSKDELDRDEIAFIEARSTLKTARLDQEVYEQFQFHKDAEQRRRDVEEADAELDRVIQENEINLRSRQTQTANRQRQLALREDRLAELQRQLEFCTIIAPRDGLVVYGSSVQSDSRRWMNDGAMTVGTEVGFNDLLIALPDTSEMTASVKVHESLAGRVRPGQRVSVKVDAIDTTIPGVVSSIGVLAETGGWRDPNRREYTVKIDLDPESARDADLRPTLRCEARIELGRIDNVLAVPVQAVFNDGPVRFVLRPLANGRFQRVPVMLGRTSDTYAEILRGLAEGDRVLIRNPQAGEVENPTAWDPELLSVAGYVLDEAGKPQIDPEVMRTMMRRPGQTNGPGGRPSGIPAGGQNPEGSATPSPRQAAPGGADGQPRQRRPAGTQGGQSSSGG